MGAVDGICSSELGRGGYVRRLAMAAASSAIRLRNAHTRESCFAQPAHGFERQFALTLAANCIVGNALKDLSADPQFAQ